MQSCDCDGCYGDDCCAVGYCHGGCCDFDSGCLEAGFHAGGGCCDDGCCCAMSTWKKPLAAASVSLSVSRSSSSCGKQPLSLSLPPTSEESTFISFVQQTIVVTTGI